ncbi:MAG: CPBP family intramembrane metalloprotease [Clostridia bacterium]|nr:CPBP family intramembrane metalloprotease [Clostridia bacterium]
MDRRQDMMRRDATSGRVVRALIALLAAAAAIFAYVVILALSGALFGSVLARSGKEVSDELRANVTTVAGIVGNAAALSGVCIIILSSRRKIAPTLRIGRFPLTAVIPCVLLGVAYNFFASCALTLAISGGAFSNDVVNSFNAMYSDTTIGNPALYIAAVALVTPVVEEVLFRGVAYGCMRHRMNKVLAAVISAVFFGLAHGNLIAFIYTFALGLILAVLFEKSGSIFLPIILHASFNTSSFLTPYIDAASRRIDPSLIFVCTASGICAAALFCLTYAALRQRNEIYE